MSGIYVARDWAGSAVNFDQDGDPEQWVYNDDLAYGVATARQVVDNIVAWLNHGDRPWTGVMTATASYPTKNPYMGATITYSEIMDVVFTGTIKTAMAMPDGNNVLTTVSTGVIPSAMGEVRLSNWIGHSSEPGALSAGGSWVMNGGGTTSDAKRPFVDVVFTEAQAVAFTTALREAVTPRIAHIYDVINDAWRLVSLGKPQARMAGHLHQRMTIPAMG